MLATFVMYARWPTVMAALRMAVWYAHVRMMIARCGRLALGLHTDHSDGWQLCSSDKGPQVATTSEAKPRALMINLRA